jgi:hypothetical protein
MIDDDVTNPPADDEVVESEEVTEAPEEAEGEEEAEVEEYSEVERAGKKYRIPKALEPELLMQADYTRKTQSVAEERKAVEAQKAMLQERAQFQEEFAEDIGKLYAARTNLQAYQNFDWNAAEQQNPQEAQRLWRQYQMLKDQAQGLEADLGRRQQQRQFEEQQETAKLIEQGRAKLAERIPGWSPETGAALVDFAVKNFGFKSEEVGRITDPRAAEVLYYARIGKESLDKARTQQKAPQQPAQPVTQLAARRAAPQTDLYRIKDPEKWAEVRNKEIAKRRSSR